MNGETTTFPDRALTKEEFLQRYVLARAAVVSSIDATRVMDDARRLWNKIQEEKKK